jgi:hypothetical protein
VKPLVAVSLGCALVSLLAIIGLSAMTVVPGPGEEDFREHWMLAAGALAVAWSGVAFWARARSRSVAKPPLPRWIGRLAVCIGVVYIAGVLFFVIG